MPKHGHAIALVIINQKFQKIKLRNEHEKRNGPIQAISEAMRCNAMYFKAWTIFNVYCSGDIKQSWRIRCNKTQTQRKYPNHEH